MNVNKEDYEYCIEVERGKYHIVLTKDYQVKFLRFGDDWVHNPPGSKMMIALMAETECKEQENKRLREALEFYAKHENHHTEWYNTPSKVGNDFGKIARQALGGDTN